MVNKSELEILIRDTTLYANLAIPDDAAALVIFAHGSGSSRHSTRNNFVADVLNRQGIATLLPDLLTPLEDENYANRFDIALLANRLVNITEVALQQPALTQLPVGYFGASTGAAAALQAAAVLDGNIRAVVSRGGRTDLSRSLTQVKAPVLLIVGSKDEKVLELNKQAFNQFTSKSLLEIVDGASHLFEEPGTLHKVADLAVDWFEEHLMS